MTATSIPQPFSGVRKFQFDEFDLESDPLDGALELSQPAVPHISLDEMNAAVSAAEAEGRRQGIEETKADLAGETVSLLQRIIEQTAALSEERRQQAETISAEAVRLAVLISRKLMPAFAESQAGREIEALIATCFKERPDESRLVIRLPDAMLDPVQSHLARLVAETGFTGKPVLLADPAMNRAEARVEWANGGADWNFDLQLAEVEAKARHLATKPIRPVSAASTKTGIADPGTIPVSDLPEADTPKETDL